MTLSEFSLQVRVMAKLLGLLVLGILFFYLSIIFVLMITAKPVQEDLHLNPVYGSIKAPIFEEGLTQEKYQYVLDTINGEYPDTTASAKVYYIPEPKSTLAYLSKIDSLAKSFDFDTTVYPSQTVDDQWVKYEDENRVLEINIVSLHFKFYYKNGAQLQTLVEATPEARFTLLENEFIEKARQGLLVRNAYPQYLATGTNNPVYQTFDLATSTFMPFEKESFPQAVRIDFFREDEELNILTPQYFSSQNYAVLAPLGYYAEIVQMQYSSFEKLSDEPGVYPLLTSEEAFLRLKQGKATTISISENHAGKIRIKKIDVGYYDPQSYQPYFQPVFVFLGSDDFVAYLPAIKDEYLVK